MQTATCSTEKQAAKVLRIPSNYDCEYEFDVIVEHGDWGAKRTITVVDDTYDIGDLMRLIASRQTDVTQIDMPEGDIYVTEAGRKFLVARWSTWESMPTDVELTFCLPQSDDNSVDVNGDEVADIQVEREPIIEE